MKKAIQVLFFFLISISAFAQEKNDSLKKENKWSIQLIPDITYTLPTFYSRNGTKFRLLWSAGINTGYRFAKGFALYTGLSLDLLGTKSIYVGTISTGASSRTHFSDYSLLSIPIFISKDVGSKNIFFSFNSGLQVSNLRRNNHRYCDDGVNCVEERQLFTNGTNNFFLFAGCRINILFNKQFILFFGFQFYKQISPFIYYRYDTSGNEYANKVYINYFKFPIGLNYIF